MLLRLKKNVYINITESVIYGVMTDLILKVAILLKLDKSMFLRLIL